MDYLNPEPKFCLDHFQQVTLVFFLRIRGRDAVPVVFLILYVFFVLSASTQTAKFSLGQLDWNAKFSILKISTSTVELSGRKLVHCARATCARDLVNFRKTKSCIARAACLAGLTVYPTWIQIWDVAFARTQSCDRKSKFRLRQPIKLNLPYRLTKSAWKNVNLKKIKTEVANKSLYLIRHVCFI